jgi:hypothetical protein
VQLFEPWGLLWLLQHALVRRTSKAASLRELLTASAAQSRAHRLVRKQFVPAPVAAFHPDFLLPGCARDTPAGSSLSTFAHARRRAMAAAKPSRSSQEPVHAQLARWLLRGRDGGAVLTVARLRPPLLAAAEGPTPDAGARAALLFAARLTCANELLLSLNGSMKALCGPAPPGAGLRRTIAQASPALSRAPLAQRRDASVGGWLAGEAPGVRSRTSSAAEFTSPCVAAVSWRGGAIDTSGKSCACCAARGRWRVVGPRDVPANP